MISRICGVLKERKEASVIIDVGGIFYEIFIPDIMMKGLDEKIQQDGRIELVTYHYLQMDTMKGMPFLFGFFNEVEKEFFAVLGTVTARGEPRTAGIVYAVRDRQLYIGSDRSAWKVRHIRNNQNVSLTVTIPKRVPFLPWIRIPAATIAFQGEASVHELEEIPQEIPRALFKGLEMDPAQKAETCILEIRPRGRFLTYGVGVSLSTMRVPEEAVGQAPV